MAYSTSDEFNWSVHLIRMKDGDQKAFEEIYNFFAPDLLSFAASRLHTLDEAEDIIHDLFVTIWADREKLSINVSLRAYLYTAVRYRIISHIRKNILKEKYSNALLGMPQIESPEAAHDVKSLSEVIEKAVSELSPRVQEVFRLSRYHQLTTKEIAEKLNTSEQTVKNQLSNALNHLRAKLGHLTILCALLEW